METPCLFSPCPGGSLLGSLVSSHLPTTEEQKDHLLCCRWIGYAEWLLCVNVCVHGAVQWSRVQGVFLPHTQCSQDRPRIQCDPDNDKINE